MDRADLMYSDREGAARALLARIGGVEPAEITPELDLVADLGIDSPKALQLLIELEDQLGIEVPDETAARIRTVADVFAFVAQHE